MKAKDLIEILKDLHPDTEIRIYKDVSSPMSFEPKYQMSELTKEDIDHLWIANIVNLG